MDEKLELFRNEPGFDKLFRRFWDKYRSVGRIGGTVKIADFSRGELEAVAGFLAVSPDVLKEKATVSLKSFEGQMAKTNLEGMTLKRLLELYFGEPLVSKSEERVVREEQEKVFYRQLAVKFPQLEWWFKRILDKMPDTRLVQTMYQQDAMELARLIGIVAKAVGMLPEEGRYERLPLFAQKVTGNPHSFDRNQPLGKLLLNLLNAGLIKSLENDEASAGLAMQTDQINELLLHYRILRDDLWSFVTCRGFLSYTNQEEHPVWKAAARFGTVMNIPVRELTVIDEIRPLNGKTVWAVENSGVCSAIMDEVVNQPIICTHGQFKAASWIFFDRLVESGCTIYYSGDMDPEGLLMAQRLKKRYPENVKIWRMDSVSYSVAKSEEKIEDRLTQLKSIEDPELKETANLLKKHGFAAYQEGLLDRLIGDILNERPKN